MIYRRTKKSGYRERGYIYILSHTSICIRMTAHIGGLPECIYIYLFIYRQKPIDVRDVISLLILGRANKGGDRKTHTIEKNAYDFGKA